MSLIRSFVRLVRSFYSLSLRFSVLQPGVRKGILYLPTAHMQKLNETVSCRCTFYEYSLKYSNSLGFRHMKCQPNLVHAFFVCNIVHQHMHNEITNSYKQGNKKSDYNDNIHSRESARKIRLCFHCSSS